MTPLLKEASLSSVSIAVPVSNTYLRQRLADTQDTPRIGLFHPLASCCYSRETISTLNSLFPVIRVVDALNQGRVGFLGSFPGVDTCG